MNFDFGAKIMDAEIKNLQDKTKDLAFKLLDLAAAENTSINLWVHTLNSTLQGSIQKLHEMDALHAYEFIDAIIGDFTMLKEELKGEQVVN